MIYYKRVEIENKFYTCFYENSLIIFISENSLSQKNIRRVLNNARISCSLDKWTEMEYLMNSFIQCIVFNIKEDNTISWRAAKGQYNITSCMKYIEDNISFFGNKSK